MLRVCQSMFNLERDARDLREQPGLDQLDYELEMLFRSTNSVHDSNLISGYLSHYLKKAGMDQPQMARVFRNTTNKSPYITASIYLPFDENGQLLFNSEQKPGIILDILGGTFMPINRIIRIEFLAEEESV